MIYAVVNQKGGVGKTTTAVNVSACLGEAGSRVLLVDLDQQANATSGLGGPRSGVATVADVLLRGLPARSAIIQTPFPNLDLLPASPDLAAAAVELPGRVGREHLLARAIDSVRADYPFILLDCPPALDLITVNALAAADRLLIPVQCEFYALEGLTRLLETVEGVRARINPRLEVTGMVLTMHDARTRVSGEVVAEVRRHFPDLAFETVVPRNVRLTEAPSHGLPVIRYDPLCPGADAYFAVAREVAGRG